MTVIIDARFYPKWPYSDAIAFMEEAFSTVKKEPHKIIIGIGSHSHQVVTLGRNPAKNRLHIPLPKSIEVHHIERGGGPTAHEPGQIVLYPVMDLAFHRLSPRDLVCILQKVAISFIESVGLKTETSAEYLGAFVDGCKVAFIGLRIRDNISSHGLSINVFNDARIFSLFDPCGIPSLRVGAVRDFIAVEGSLDEMGRRLYRLFEESVCYHSALQPSSSCD